jgi:hypothetical protein
MVIMTLIVKVLLFFTAKILRVILVLHLLILFRAEERE